MRQSTVDCYDCRLHISWDQAAARVVTSLVNLSKCNRKLLIIVYDELGAPTPSSVASCQNCHRPDRWVLSHHWWLARRAGAPQSFLEAKQLDVGAVVRVLWTQASAHIQW